MNQEFILRQKPGHIFPYKGLSNVAMPNPVYKGLSSAPQILLASNLLRRDGRKLSVRLLWKKSDPAPRAMGAGAQLWTSHHHESQHDRLCSRCPQPQLGRASPGSRLAGRTCPGPRWPLGRASPRRARHGAEHPGLPAAQQWGRGPCPGVLIVTCPDSDLS